MLYYFLKTPLTGYLKDRDADHPPGPGGRRGHQVGGDRPARRNRSQAEGAARRDRRARASAGQEEIAAEEQRIVQQAAAERDRLLEQARRDIDVQVRLAKRELTEHAADLAVELAADRIAKETTPADHARLVNRYLTQVKR